MKSGNMHGYTLNALVTILTLPKFLLLADASNCW